jgi:hypothetical protein
MQNFDHNIGFEKNVIFFAENWQKLQKIVIITSTPVRQDWAILRLLGYILFSLGSFLLWK